jgi:hypothetical protein
MIRKNAAITPPTPRTKSTANMPSTSGSFDFFFGGATATAACLGGNGALCAGGSGADVGGGGGGGIVPAGGCKFAAVAEPVGPVFFGSTTVGALDEVAIVALKSGVGLLAGFSLGGSAGAVPRFDERAMVALGSKG